MCEGCGEYLGDGDGFPRYCAGCRPGRNAKRTGFIVTSPTSDPSVRVRRWLEAASAIEGVLPDRAPSFLPKLARRGFVYLDDLALPALCGDPPVKAYFITNAGRAELARIGGRPITNPGTPPALRGRMT
jgi:hypothetical protein